MTIYDTILVYDTVYKFAEVKEEVTFTDPLSEETLTVYNYGEYLQTSREFTDALVYNILGSEVKQITLSDQIPVSDLESGVYLFVFKMDTGKAFRKKIFIE